jgi:hypothetical protein
MPGFAHAPPRRERIAISLTFGAWLCAAASRAAFADPAATITPDQHQLVLSRDIAGLHWLISLRFDGGEVSGNVFDPAGGVPRFVRCRLSALRGADLVYGCAVAESCASERCADEWQPISEEVAVPLSYFRAGTFRQTPEAILGEWPGEPGEFDFSFREVVSVDGATVVRGVGSRDARPIQARVVGDGVNAFAYELLDAPPGDGGCDLFRFNQISPRTLAGVRFRTAKAADGSCQPATERLVGGFAGLRYPP